ncbi:MAG: DUF3098 domain-containing protein [Ignavibacteria bacterium]|nr:DUF3098 domain-containing protein [Ignavibacteria bacterium]
MAKQIKSNQKSKVAWVHPWTRRQYVIIGVGLAVIIAGFLLLSTGISTSWDNPLAVSVAPVVLVIGYCVIIPIALLVRKKDAE